MLTTEAHPLLVPQNGKWVQPGKGPRTFWSGPASASNTTSAAGTGKTGTAYTGGEASNTAPGLLTNAQKHSVYKAWRERVAEKERKEAAAQARIALSRAVSMAKERGEDAVSALVARMKGWVGGNEEEEAAELQKRSSILDSEGSEGTASISAAAVDATAASSAPEDGALMSRVKSELNALISSALGAMDEDTSSDSAPPQASSPSSTTSPALPDGYVSILVETDVEVPVEVRFLPQAFAHMEMTDEELARWLARENSAPARTVTSWDLLEIGAGRVKGQVPFGAAAAQDEEQQEQHVEQASPSLAVAEHADEVDEAEAEPQGGSQGEEDLLSLEHVSAIGVDVLRAALRSMEQHFAVTPSPSSSPSPTGLAAAAGQDRADKDSDSDTASTRAADSCSSSPPSSSSPPAPAPQAKQAEREGDGDAHRGGAPRGAMGFGGRMMYRAQAGQRLREEREEALRAREREQRERALERAMGGGGVGGSDGASGDLLRRARGMEDGDAPGDGLE